MRALEEGLLKTKREKELRNAILEVAKKPRLDHTEIIRGFNISADCFISRLYNKMVSNVGYKAASNDMEKFQNGNWDKSDYMSYSNIIDDLISIHKIKLKNNWGRIIKYSKQFSRDIGPLKKFYEENREEILEMPRRSLDPLGGPMMYAMEYIRKEKAISELSRANIIKIGKLFFIQEYLTGTLRTPYNKQYKFLPPSILVGEAGVITINDYWNAMVCPENY